jgi:hypothetical protein
LLRYARNDGSKRRQMLLPQGVEQQQIAGFKSTAKDFVNGIAA